MGLKSVARSFPIGMERDVIVCGGGTSGVVAGGCMVTGQAAGTAAAIAVRDGVTPRKVDVKKLQTLLKEQGAIL